MFVLETLCDGVEGIVRAILQRSWSTNARSRRRGSGAPFERWCCHSQCCWSSLPCEQRACLARMSRGARWRWHRCRVGHQDLLETQHRRKKGQRNKVEKSRRARTVTTSATASACYRTRESKTTILQVGSGSGSAPVSCRDAKPSIVLSKNTHTHKTPDEHAQYCT